MSLPFRFTLPCAIAACLGACSSPRRTAEETLDRAGPDRLRKDAALLYKNVFAAAASTSFRTLKVDDCPATFRMFNPQHVVAYRDGFGLALQRGPSGESGLYVVPDQMDVAPNPGRRARFERIADGIYWYSFEP
jgi:hypothetical protein